MGELKIVYYMNIKTGEIEPLLEEKNVLNFNQILIRKLHSFLLDLKIEIGEVEKFKSYMDSCYYVDLLRKGYTFEKMNEVLVGAFRKQYNIPGHKSYLDPILNQQKNLALASRRYNKNSKVEGLSEFFLRFCDYMVDFDKKTIEHCDSKKLKRLL